MKVLYCIVSFVLVISGVGYTQNEEINFGYLDKDSLRQGLWGYCDSISGTNTTETYRNDTLNGLTTIIQGNFLNEINYQKGRKNSWIREYYKGVLSEAILYDAGFIIYVRLYDLKGRIKEEYQVKNGEKEGVNIIYRKGKISRLETFKKGLNDGKVIYYYKAGTPHYIYDYLNDEKTGDWIELDKVGHIINSNLHK